MADKYKPTGASPRNDDTKVVPIDSSDMEPSQLSWKVGWAADSSSGSKRERSQSICTKEMRSSTRRPTLERLITEDLDRDGDGTVTMEEMMGFLDRHVSLDKNNKETKKALMATFFLLFLSVILNGMAALGANEASKESHVTGGAMMDLSGNPVTVESPESFANLWDLPTFSSRTLAEMRHITLALSTGAEVTLDIASAMKTPGTASATFRSTDGSSILIDAVARVALVNWNDESYVVSSVSGRRNLAEARGGQLYHAGDFFSLENGFHVDLEGNHRRLADSDNQGYAAFALSAGKEMMDMASDEDNVEYSSVYFRAEEHDDGNVNPVQVFYTDSPDPERAFGSKVFAGNEDGTSYLTDHGLGFYFSYDAAGELVKCAKIPDDADDGSAGLAGLAVTVSDDGLQLVLADDTSDNLLVVNRNSIQYDTDGSQIPTPSVEACHELGLKSAEYEVDPNGFTEVDPVVDESAGRRLGDNQHSGWVGQGSTTDLDLWKLSQAAYAGKGAPSGWSLWKTVTVDNAVAKFFYKAPTMVIAFAGTDGLSDIGDWANNLDTKTFDTGSVRVHNGFKEYAGKLMPDLNDGIAQLHSWGIEIDFLAGHSLGGAAATVFSQLTNNPAERGVWSFGAPKTRNDGSCSVSGKRFQHESDSIASNVMGVMESFNHDIKDSYTVQDRSYCKKRNWWGTCKKWVDDKQVNAKGCNDVPNVCKNWWDLVQCGYYFATVHSQYGDYVR